MFHFKIKLKMFHFRKKRLPWKTAKHYCFETHTLKLTQTQRWVANRLHAIYEHVSQLLTHPRTLNSLINCNLFLQPVTGWKRISESAARSIHSLYQHCERFVDAPSGDEVSHKNDWRLNLQACVFVRMVGLSSRGLSESSSRHLENV